MSGRLNLFGRAANNRKATGISAFFEVLAAITVNLIFLKNRCRHKQKGLGNQSKSLNAHRLKVQLPLNFSFSQNP